MSIKDLFNAKGSSFKSGASASTDVESRDLIREVSKENETFFDFDEEGFIEDALYQLKCELKYDRVFRNGDEE